MANRRRKMVIRDAATVRALRATLRQEVLNALEGPGGRSVKEVALELGRPAASLYYHVHKLVEAGLVREAGRRTNGRQEEVLYEAAADTILIDRSVRSKDFVAALSDLQRSTLRAAEREAARALESPPRPSAPAGDPVTLLRLSTKLSRADARRARRKLKELAAFLESRNDPAAADSFSFTAVLVST